MKVLSSPVAKANPFTDNNTNSKLSSSSSSTTTRVRFFQFPYPNKKKSVDSLSLRFVYHCSGPSSSSTLSLKTQAVVTNSSLSGTIDHAETVHVKFQLQRECLFGEQFLLVGDDPIVGLWQPENAIPLDWSNEHIWTVELDLPIGKSIRFKFILKRGTKEVLWQPGPDRILETWATKDTIVVSEDWENAESQKVKAEPRVDADADPEIDLIVADDSSYPKVERNSMTLGSVVTKSTVLEEKSNASSNKAIVIVENVTVKEYKALAKRKEGSLVAGNICGGNDIVLTDKKLGGVQDDLVGYVEGPVLVPGLTPSVNITTEEASWTKYESNSHFADSSPKITTEEVSSTKSESNSHFDASSGTNIADNSSMPEPYEKQENERKEVHSIPDWKATTCTLNGNESNEEQHDREPEDKFQLNGEHEHSDCEAAVQDTLHNDFQWGRNTLRKLFTTLGISMDQT